MSFFDDLDDPWKSDQPASSSGVRNEWTTLNAGTFAGSEISATNPLNSPLNPDFGVTALDRNVNDTSINSIGAIRLLSDHQEDVPREGWDESLDTTNHRVSSELVKGNMAAEEPFVGAAVADSASSGRQDFESWSEAVRKSYNPLVADIIVVEELPEREGLLFKHTNYLVRHLIDLPDTSPSSDRSVIRRYSDFVWLQEVLLKKYPFRMIPDLPPKRIGSHTTDPVFSIKRRNGLSRFINLVVKHPVFKKDDLVLTFLTVPTDLLGWRKQASYDTSDEFTDRKVSVTFVKMWHKGLAERWNEADANIDTALELWAKITVLIDRYERRMAFIAQDRDILRSMLDQFTEGMPHLFNSDDGSTNVIGDHLGRVSKHFGSCNELVSQENQEACKELSPRFRTFTDTLLALKGLFERYKAMAGNNVPQLQRRIEVNSDRLEQMKDKPDLKGAEYDRVKQSIQRDRKAIAEQMNRSWLVRECILQEYVYFQEAQFLISDIFQRWVLLNMKYYELNSNEWDKLLQDVQSMPTSRQ